MSEIQDRLKITSEECLKCFTEWDKDRKKIPERESLQDAIHELRKVASRLEIELAIAERDQMAQKPIAIPQHRNSKNRNQKKDNVENFDGVENAGDTKEAKPKIQRRRPQRRSAAAGTPKASEE